MGLDPTSTSNANVTPEAIQNDSNASPQKKQPGLDFAAAAISEHSARTGLSAQDVGKGILRGVAGLAWVVATIPTFAGSGAIGLALLPLTAADKLLTKLSQQLVKSGTVGALLSWIPLFLSLPPKLIVGALGNLTLLVGAGVTQLGRIAMNHTDSALATDLARYLQSNFAISASSGVSKRLAALMRFSLNGDAKTIAKGLFEDLKTYSPLMREESLKNILNMVQAQIDYAKSTGNSQNQEKYMSVYIELYQLVENHFRSIETKIIDPNGLVFLASIKDYINDLKSQTNDLKSQTNDLKSQIEAQGIFKNIPEVTEETVKSAIEDIKKNITDAKNPDDKEKWTTILYKFINIVMQNNNPNLKIFLNEKETALREQIANEMIASLPKNEPPSTSDLENTQKAFLDKMAFHMKMGNRLDWERYKGALETFCSKLLSKIPEGKIEERNLLKSMLENALKMRLKLF